MAHKVEELPLFSEAREFCVAVTAILERSRLRRNSKQYEQIFDANESVLSNFDEGFAQESDDQFAKYLYYSKGSIAEVVRRVRTSAARGGITPADVDRLSALGEELGRKYGGFIKYLKRCGFKDRGRFRASQE